ncbi:hypothetical protein [Aliiruegeria lutimaris]|uniref:Uncharacterized protein n=1 Tax=Aliiruegeria lutimaris TaxID=571298 RepID=A0A1G8YEP8_9RHOB|nr:hypothetical protein [Aliiruegeria lutimaris]SDK01389.1 hypothetical protein SAMN04488026_10293 [Aliiruegeria lutimaris]
MFQKWHGLGTMARLWFRLSYALANRIGDTLISGRKTSGSPTA